MATKPRAFGSADGSPTGTFDVTSRCCDNSFKFETASIRDKFIAIMRAYEEFSGVEVLGYVLMTNHFHILVRVPKLPDNYTLSDAEWGRKMRLVQGKRQWSITFGQLRRLRAAGDDAGAEALKAKAYRRMGNIWEFIKGLKEAFTKWYNHVFEHDGTIWQRQFDSRVVADEATTLQAISAHMDLNPMRTGLTKDPSTYAWSNYGAALAGDSSALARIKKLMGEGPGRGADDPQTLEQYRSLISSVMARQWSTA